MWTTGNNLRKRLPTYIFAGICRRESYLCTITNWLLLNPKLQKRENEKQISFVQNYQTFNTYFKRHWNKKPSGEYFQHKTLRKLVSD